VPASSGWLLSEEIDMVSPEILYKLPEAFNSAAAVGMNCIIHFVTSAPAYFIVKDGTCTLMEGDPANADLTVIITDDNLVALLKGRMNPATGLLLGKFKIKGNKGIGIKLKTMFDPAKLR
jgi:putative sterol carrier protein